MALHNEIGKIGEDIVKTFLVKHGFTVLQRNYRVPGGELDVIAEKDNILHFVEVKSLKVKDFKGVGTMSIKPEDNLTEHKWKHVVRSALLYNTKHNAGKGAKRWQIDLACVYIHTTLREGRVTLMQNIHKEGGSFN